MIPSALCCIRDNIFEKLLAFKNLEQCSVRGIYYYLLLPLDDNSSSLKLL